MAIFDGVELEDGKTPWAVKSGHCGDELDDFRVYLDYDEYMRQLCRPNSLWCCPHGYQAHWDDDWYETFMEAQEELYYQQLDKEAANG